MTPLITYQAIPLAELPDYVRDIIKSIGEQLKNAKTEDEKNLAWERYDKYEIKLRTVFGKTVTRERFPIVGYL